MPRGFSHPLRKGGGGGGEGRRGGGREGGREELELRNLNPVRRKKRGAVREKKESRECLRESEETGVLDRRRGGDTLDG